jgi:hypothetical protein
MSQAIRKFPVHLVDDMVQRRIHNETKGLGYWSAIDYKKRDKRAEMHKKEAAEARDQMIKAGIIKPVGA